MEDIQNRVEELAFLNHFNLLAHQIVEGFISGIHKSPFHGFSSEFAEHKIYNQGESTKNIDWKVYAKTDKFFVKTYEDETNLRCQVLVDNSSSMHYPNLTKTSQFPGNKIQYAALTAAALLKIIKKQRDAAGLTIFSDKIDFSMKEQGNERHHRQLIEQLNKICFYKPQLATTKLSDILHQIAEKTHKRSLIVLFTDLLHTNTNLQELIQALQHLKHNKHKVIVFHVVDQKTELELDFTNQSKKFIDLETGEEIEIHTEHVKEIYKQNIKSYWEKISQMLTQYQIEYHLLDINQNIEKSLTQYLTERQKFK